MVLFSSVDAESQVTDDKYIVELFLIVCVTDWSTVMVLAVAMASGFVPGRRLRWPITLPTLRSRCSE